MKNRALARIPWYPSSEDRPNSTLQIGQTLEHYSYDAARSPTMRPTTAFLLSLVVASHAFVTPHVSQARHAVNHGATRSSTSSQKQHNIRQRTHAFSTAVAESAPPSTRANNDKDKRESDHGSVEERVSFSHIHLYVDSVEDVGVYKKMEADLNQLSSRIAEMGEEANDNTSGDGQSSGLDIEKCRMLYDDITGRSSSKILDEEFVPQGRDVVKQLMAGLGFRVTGQRMADSNTKSVLVTTKDPNGVQIVVTSLGGDSEKDQYSHFDASNIQRFFDSHSNRQGIAVLAFEVTSGSIDTIHNRYMEMHPKLVTPQGIQTYEDGTKVLEVYAYYQGDVRESDADCGTVLRFVQRKGNADGNSMSCILPGLEPVDAVFDPSSQAAYCDHWVSNVISRTGFIDTLADVLQFTPKVDFNAGVVAAGEAQIESTVTGNDSPLSTTEVERALRDQSQVYLPINNALSEVGHVHGFLEEIGQGIQHVASRVNDLPSFVQRGNDYRKITGEGLTFLNIPRSYYGVLMESQFDQILASITARAVMDVCESTQITSAEGAVDLELAGDDISRLLDSNMPEEYQKEYQSKKDEILDIILRSRYANLYSLLRDHLTEEAYLKIVRNKILVDLQGDDLLLQIFTSNILQRKVGNEAPFFEYIQRVCSECLDENGCPATLKPGCGGFGIRNFLTLFLSIEVSKAMVEVSQAKASGDDERQIFAQTMVDVFTAQLNESNPILTEISDAMTLEGNLKTQLDIALSNNNLDEVQSLRLKLDEAGKAKAAGNTKLMECSMKYKVQMRALRESRG